METIKQQMEFLKGFDIEKMGREGEAIYEAIKGRYEPQENGKYLAIETESRQAYFGETSEEAVNLALRHHPDKIFFLAEIGCVTDEEQIKSYFEEINDDNQRHLHQEYALHPRQGGVA